jgi:hypothetical protein
VCVCVRGCARVVGPYNVTSQHYRIISVLISNMKIIKINILTNIRNKCCILLSRQLYVHTIAGERQLPASKPNTRLSADMQYLLEYP